MHDRSTTTSTPGVKANEGKPITLSNSCYLIKVNEAAFELAVEQVREAAHTLIHSLKTNAAPRDRESEREKALAESAKRFGTQYRRAGSIL